MIRNRRVWFAALAAAMVALATASAACEAPNSSDQPSQTATDPVETLPPAKQTGQAMTPPTPTPLPAVGPACPVEPFVCDAALQITSAIAMRDTAALMRMTAPLSVSCTKDQDIYRALLPLCEGAADGASVQGVAVFAKVAGFVPAGDFARSLELYFPSYEKRAQLTKVTVACPGPGGNDCGGYFAIGVLPDFGEGALVFVLKNVPGGPKIVGLRNWPYPGAQFGGWSNTGHPGTDFPDQMWFIPWKAR